MVIIPTFMHYKKRTYLIFSFSVTGDWGCGPNAIGNVDGIKVTPTVAPRDTPLWMSYGISFRQNNANCPNMLPVRGHQYD